MANQEKSHTAFSYQMSRKYFKTKEPDVNFIFEEGGETVKIPAHKVLLAVSSPVFDAMFNSELKEKGDVKIVDASAAGFKEFLQFFYSDEVKLTMENIEDVLNLAHKYDISEVIDAAVKFIKENLAKSKTMWCLELAIRYQSDELKAFCKENIAKDPLSALNGDFGEDEDQVDSSTDQHELSSTNCILKEALSIAKDIISKQSTELKYIRSKYTIPYILSCSTVYTYNKISFEETTQFYRNDSGSLRLWLSEIFFANIYNEPNTKNAIHLKGSVTIKREDSPEILFTKEFGMNSVEKHVKLPKPIEIERSIPYLIIIKPLVGGYAHKIVSSSRALANTEHISRIGPDYTLIDRLHFEEDSQL